MVAGEDYGHGFFVLVVREAVRFPIDAENP